MNSSTRIAALTLLSLSVALSACAPTGGGGGGTGGNTGGSSAPAATAGACAAVAYGSTPVDPADLPDLLGFTLPSVPDCLFDQGEVAGTHDYQFLYLDAQDDDFPDFAAAVEGSKWLPITLDAQSGDWTDDQHQTLIIQYFNDPVSVGSGLTDPFITVNLQLNP